MNERRHVAACVFLLFLFYMPIVSACCRALSCTGHRIDGARWLLDDLSVKCYVGQHAVAVALAVAMLVLFGAGFPAAIWWTLVRAPSHRLQDKQFVAAFGFLYLGRLGYQRGDRGARRDAVTEWSGGQLQSAEAATVVISSREDGRRVHWWAVPCRARWTAARFCCARLAAGPQTKVWWEAVILLRKAVLVVLAMVVTEPFYQVVVAVLLFSTATVLQQRTAPYSTAAFNNLESAILIDLYVTVSVSTLLLPSAVGAKVSSLSASITDSISIVVLGLNLATTAVLGGAVAWYAGSTVAAAVRSRATKKKVMARRPSVMVPVVPQLAADDEAAAGDNVAPTASPCNVTDDEPAIDNEAAASTAGTGTVETAGLGGAGAVRRQQVLLAAAAVPSAGTTADATADGGTTMGGVVLASVVGASSRRVRVVSLPLDSRSVPAMSFDSLSTNTGTGTGIGTHNYDAWALPATLTDSAHAVGGAGATAVAPAVAAEASTVTQLSRAVVVEDTHKLRAAPRLAPQPSRRDNRRSTRGASGGGDVVGVWR